MKRFEGVDVHRRLFLTGAAATVIGVALDPPTVSYTFANDTPSPWLDCEADAGGLHAIEPSQLIRKKVCMLGASAVGKTSLVKRFVESIYGEQYMDSVGVKVDKKEVEIGGRKVVILLWDVKAGDDFQSLRTSYLRNASGIVLVVDGTRRLTLEAALDLRRRVNEGAGPAAPSSVLVLNKDDLSSQWEVLDSDVANLKAEKIPVIRGSAKTGRGVEDAFLTLATMMLDK